MAIRKFLGLKDAFEQSLNRFIKDFELTRSDLKDPTVIKTLGLLTKMTMEELYTPEKTNKFDFEVAVQESLEKRYFYDPPEYDETDLDNIDKSLEVLNSHPAHEQRSLEWYSFRQGRVTASDVSKAMGKKGDKSRWDLIYQKAITVQEYIAKRESFSLDSKPAIRHGKCFEDVAIALYEKRNNVRVKDYGCLPHLFIDHLAASPDGIVYSRETNPNYHGRMLEIKCPYSRIINGIIKLEYYMQIQTQLEVCDLEYCDFLECDIRVYNTMVEFLNDSPPGQKSYTHRANGLEKGVLCEYKRIGESSFSYKYCPLGLTDDQVRQWIKDTRTETSEILDLDIRNFNYWYLEEYNVVLVKRELEYFEDIQSEVANFWNLVQYYKKNGLDPVKEKIGLLPRQPTDLEKLLKDRPPEEVDGLKIQKGVCSNSGSSSPDTFKNDLDQIDFLDFDQPDPEVKTEAIKEIKNKPKRKTSKVEDNLDFLELNSESEEEELAIEVTQVTTTMVTSEPAGQGGSKSFQQFRSLTVIKPE